MQDIKPWTVKGIAPEHRSAFTAAAKRSGLDIGPWVVRAGLAHIQAERAEQRAPAVIAPSRDPAELAGVVAMAVDLAGVSGGVVPKGVERLAWAVMRSRLRAMR